MNKITIKPKSKIPKEKLQQQYQQQQKYQIKVCK